MNHKPPFITESTNFIRNENGFSYSVFSEDNHSFWSSLSGISPKRRLVLPPEISREEFKNLALKKLHAISSRAFITPKELAIEIVQSSNVNLQKDVVQNDVSKYEIKRWILKEWIQNTLDDSSLGYSKALEKLRRQKHWLIDRLSTEILASRFYFASEEELSVQIQILQDKGVLRERDKVLFSLLMFVGRVIDLNPGWDEAKLYSLATECVRQISNEEHKKLTDGLLWIEVSPLLRRVESFRESLKVQTVSWSSIEPIIFHRECRKGNFINLMQCHSEVDLTEALGTQVLESMSNGVTPQLIFSNDSSSELSQLIRFSFERRGIPIRDPRSPQLVQLEESYKEAMFPLYLVGKSYLRADVEDLYLRYSSDTYSHSQKNIRKIRENAIEQGLENYRFDSDIYSKLLIFEKTFGGRKNIIELRDAHLNWIKEHQSRFLNAHFHSNMQTPFEYWEDLWKRFIESSQRFEIYSKSVRVLVWAERLMSFLKEEAPTHYSRYQPVHGVELHRLGQVILSENTSHEIHLIGFNPNSFIEKKRNDLLFTESVRVALCSEFGVPTGKVELDTQKIFIKKLFNHHINLWESKYSLSGSEIESSEIEWNNLLEAESGLSNKIIIEKIAAPISTLTWNGSQGAIEKTKIQIQLPKWNIDQIGATDLDHFSRCPFRGTATARWKLRTLDEPSDELWATERGKLLHTAVAILLASSEGAWRESHIESGKKTWNAKLTPKEAISTALVINPIRGWTAKSLLQRSQLDRLESILKKFIDKEKEYRERSGTNVLTVEEPELRFNVSGIQLMGKPDRIDTYQSEKAEGLFIMDFKSSSQGFLAVEEGLEKSYRLQLPFYAVAAIKNFKKSVLGVQVIELNSEGSRGSGIFFDFLNGKDQGCLTQARKNQKALISKRLEELEDFWLRVEKKIEESVNQFKSGVAHIKPQSTTLDCDRCSYDRLCGRSRWQLQSENSNPEKRILE